MASSAAIVMIVLLVLGAGMLSLGVVGVRADTTGEENLTEATSYANDSEQFVKVLCERQRHYSVTCLKLDAVRLIERLAHTPAYQLTPGISLVHADYPPATPLPRVVVTRLAEGNASALDTFLAARVTDYLNSLTLTVKVLDSGTVDSARRLGEEILSGSYYSQLQTGRKKGGGGAALYAAGTMAAVGMAALAAVSGKALMTSMLALMLAAAGALRGGGGGGGDSGKCHSAYAYPAARRSIAIQERPVYRPAYGVNVSPTYGPPIP